MKPNTTGSVVCFPIKGFTEIMVENDVIIHEKRLTRGSELVYLKSRSAVVNRCGKLSA
jgi:hypothetical protein